MYSLARVQHYAHRFRTENLVSWYLSAVAYPIAVGTFVLVVVCLVRGSEIPENLLKWFFGSAVAATILWLLNRRVVYLFDDRMVTGIHLKSDQVLFARVLLFSKITSFATFFDEKPFHPLQPPCYQFGITPLLRWFTFRLRHQRDAYTAVDFLIERIPIEVIDPETVALAKKRRAKASSRQKDRSEHEE